MIGNAPWAEAIPVPKPRPSPAASADARSLQEPAEAPLPRPRPEREPPAKSAAEKSADEERTAAAPPQPLADLPAPAIDPGAEVACRWRLKELGVVYEEMEPIKSEGGCGAAAPIRVSELGGGIGLTPPATLNCRTAEALARWAQEVVVPAAERHLDAAPTSLVNAASYVCRPRNNRPGAKLSEHATANAIDIAAIAFEEREAVAIVGRDSDELSGRAFQRAIRRGACEHFTTVLGPGTDAAHARHFHLDLAQRRRGYRLCQ